MKSRRKNNTEHRGKVLLDEIHVEVWVPQGLSDRKARTIRKAVEGMLRHSEELIEHVVQTMARTKPGEISVRIGDGS